MINKVGSVMQNFTQRVSSKALAKNTSSCVTAWLETDTVTFALCTQINLYTISKIKIITANNIFGFRENAEGTVSLQEHWIKKVNLCHVYIYTLCRQQPRWFLHFCLPFDTSAKWMRNSRVLGGSFRFFSGLRSLQYKAEHLGWSGSLLLQTEAALIGDFGRKQINYRYVLYMTSLQKTRAIPLITLSFFWFSPLWSSSWDLKQAMWTPP